MMTCPTGGLRPQRGRTLPISVDLKSSAKQILAVAEKKMKDFNKDLLEGPYVLLYPDGTEVVTIPGTQRPFSLDEYKEEIGKPYARINLFIFLKEDFEGG